MSEKSRLHRTRKEIIYSIKTQQQVEVFPAKEFEFAFDMLSAFLPGTGSKRIKLNTSFYFLTWSTGEVNFSF